MLDEANGKQPREVGSSCDTYILKSVLRMDTYNGNRSSNTEICISLDYNVNIFQVLESERRVVIPCIGNYCTPDRVWDFPLSNGYGRSC